MGDKRETFQGATPETSDCVLCEHCGETLHAPEADIFWEATVSHDCTEMQVTALRARLEVLERLDREAATYVESVIAMRTDFTGDPPYVGWRGLGLALNEALDAKERAEARLEVVTEERNVQRDLCRAAEDAADGYKARLEAVEKDRNEWRDLSVSYLTQKSDAKARAERAEAALTTARRDALEEAAEIAESHKPSSSFISERYWRGVDEAAHSIAVAIQALIAQEDAQG